MNNKESELYRILDNVVKCCATQVDETGKMSLTKDDVLGKSRTENVVMTRCIFVQQVLNAGFSITTLAQLLNKTVPAVRHLAALDLQYLRTSRAYRIASSEATLLNKDI